MIRIIASLIGAAFVGVLAWGLFGTVSGLITDPPAETVVEAFHKAPKNVSFASDGVFGKYDKRQLQRGLQVYTEVCSNCHSLAHVHFRDLADLGYSEGQVKKFASDWDQKAKQDAVDPKSGEHSERGNTPADLFPTVYYPGQGNPPDLSMVVKAREGGPQYVYSILTGYEDQPAELLKKFPDAKTPDGLYFNPYFANLNIAMPPPLTQDGQVTYLDGTKSTVKQNARDIAAFLTWAAEPKLEARHTAGFATIVFLLIFCGLAWGAYQNVWRDVKH